MKTRFIFLICMLSFILVKAEELRIAEQYTFTNPCTPLVNITAIPNTYGCYAFTASNGIVNDPDNFYTWNFGNNTNATGKSVYHCFPPVLVPSVATVTLTYNSPALCGVTPNVQTFTIALGTPTAGTCYNPNPDLTVNGYSVTITIFPGIPEIMFRYHYGDGYWSDFDNTHVYGNCGSYIVTVKNWDMNNPQDTCYGYAAVNISCDVAAGIGEKKELKPARVFPNPGSHTIFIEANETIQYICLYDLLGKELIRTETSDANEYKLTIAHFENGAYQLKILYQNGKQQYAKIIKQ